VRRLPRVQTIAVATLALVYLPGCDLPGSKAGQRPASSASLVAAPSHHPGSPRADDIPKLLDQWHELNSECRGGPGDVPATLQACSRREEVAEKVRAQGWCYGENAAYGYQAEWRECGNPRFPSTAAAEAAAAAEF